MELAFQLISILCTFLRLAFETLQRMQNYFIQQVNVRYACTSVRPITISKMVDNIHWKLTQSMNWQAKHATWKKNRWHDNWIAMKRCVATRPLLHCLRPMGDRLCVRAVCLAHRNRDIALTIYIDLLSMANVLLDIPDVSLRSICLRMRSILIGFGGFVSERWKGGVCARASAHSHSTFNWHLSIKWLCARRMIFFSQAVPVSFGAIDG